MEHDYSPNKITSTITRYTYEDNELIGDAPSFTELEPTMITYEAIPNVLNSNQVTLDFYEIKDGTSTRFGEGTIYVVPYEQLTYRIKFQSYKGEVKGSEQFDLIVSGDTIRLKRETVEQDYNLADVYLGHYLYEQLEDGSYSLTSYMEDRRRARDIIDHDILHYETRGLEYLLEDDKVSKMISTDYGKQIEVSFYNENKVYSKVNKNGYAETNIMDLADYQNVHNLLLNKDLLAQINFYQRNPLIDGFIVQQVEQD